MNHLSQILLGASRHASTDATRPHLSSVRLSWSLGAWIAMATDGHTLFVASAKGDGEPFEALYDAKAVAKGAKLAKARDGYCIREEGNVLAFSDGAGSVLRVDPRVLTSVQYPPVTQVIPRELPAGGRGGFNAAYLAEHCETHSLFTSKKTNAIMLATAADPLDPMMVLSEDPDGVFSCLSVIMPMRVGSGNDFPGERIREWIRARSGAPVAAAATAESEAAQ